MRSTGSRLACTLLLTAACAAPDGEPIEITHDVCTPIALSADGADPAQRAGVIAAMELWAARGVATLALASPAAIELRFEAAAPPFHGLYDDRTSVVYVNRSLTDPAALAIVIAHELGHAFGLLHVEQRERASLMNPGNLATPPTEADRRAVDALWGPCGAAAPLSP